MKIEVGLEDWVGSRVFILEWCGEVNNLEIVLVKVVFDWLSLSFFGRRFLGRFSFCDILLLDLLINYIIFLFRNIFCYGV